MDKNLVRKIQQRLKDLGYSPGKVDGALGPNTARAVAEFQRHMNLDVRWPGTIGPKTLDALSLSDPKRPLVLPWMLEAARYLGLHEVRDGKALDKALNLNSRSIPWCGAFCALIIRDGLPGEPIPSNPLWARNWGKFGVPLEKDKPILGCIAVFERGSGGHVGPVIGHDKTHLHIRGGNQSDSVTDSRIAKNRLLQLRYPTTFANRGPVLPLTTISASVSTNEA